MALIQKLSDWLYLDHGDLSHIKQAILDAAPLCRKCNKTVEGIELFEDWGTHIHVVLKCHGAQLYKCLPIEQLKAATSLPGYLESFRSEAVFAPATDLKSINAYLITRKDLFPRCVQCNKAVKKIELLPSNLLRFSCHNKQESKYISASILSSQDKIYEYLQNLKHLEVFKPATFDYSSVGISSISSCSLVSTSGFFVIASSGQMIGSSWNQPAKRAIPQPKKPPVLAPILPTQPVKRAITFDD